VSCGNAPNWSPARGDHLRSPPYRRFRFVSAKKDPEEFHHSEPCELADPFWFVSAKKRWLDPLAEASEQICRWNSLA